jgi:hypothetical protein
VHKTIGHPFEVHQPCQKSLWAPFGMMEALHREQVLLKGTGRRHLGICEDGIPAYLCPRCQSLNVGPWGTSHAQPGLKRYRCQEQGCTRTFNALTGTLLDGSKRSVMHWILATFLLCLSCAPRRIAKELGSMPARATAGAGGCLMWPCPMRSVVKSGFWSSVEKRA